MIKEQLKLTLKNPMVRDHKVYGQQLLPGLAYMDLIYQVFQKYDYQYNELELQNLSIFNPLVVEEDRAVLLDISCMEEEEDVWQIRIEGEEDFNRNPGFKDMKTGYHAQSHPEKKLYVTARMLRKNPVVFEETLDVNTIKKTAIRAENIDELYKQCRQQELIHTDFMKSDATLYYLEQGVVVDISVGQSALSTADQFMFHPALIDGSGICLMRMFSEDDKKEMRLFLPLFYGSFRASGLLTKKCYTRIKTSRIVRKKELISATLEFFNEDGKKVAELTNFTNKLVRDAGLINRKRGRDLSQNRNTGSRMEEKPLSSNAEAFLRNLLAERLNLPAEQIDIHSGYYEMGIDSPGLLEVVQKIEIKVGTALAPTLLFEYTNIRELANYLSENYPERFNIQKSYEKTVEFSNAAVIKTHRQNEESHNETLEAFTTGNRLAIERDIAVIGMAGRYPGARNIEEFWENLKQGKKCVTEVPKSRWDWHKLDGIQSPSGKDMSRWGGFIDNVECFDPKFFRISPREAETMDPQERLFLEVCWEAVEDAGYTPKTLVRPKGQSRRQYVGVYTGVMHKDYALNGAEAIKNGEIFPLSLNYAPIANRVSYFCDFHGPSMAVDTVCSSSLTAIHLAIESVKSGESEVALAGGVNLSLHPYKYMSYGLMGLHSSEGLCRAFGKGGDGYVSAEGVGVIVLKPLSKAIEDNDHIYAVIKGSSINHVGTVSGITVPSPVAQADMLLDCLQKTQVHPRTMSYIEAHGTGTSLGDPIEIHGLTKAFGQYTKDKQYCSIGSVKTNIGHAESAAGICGLTKLILQLYHKTLVPSLHSEELNPYIDFSQSPFYVQRELAEWKQPVLVENGQEICYPRRGGVSSFGATGSNAHIIVEEYNPVNLPLLTHEGPVAVPLSSKNRERLLAYAGKLLDFIKKQLPYKDVHDKIWIRNLAYTLQVGRVAMEERVVFLVRDITELMKGLEEFLQNKEEIENGYQGFSKQNKEYVSLFNLDEEFKELQYRWIVIKRIEKLAKIWAKGIDIEWEQLYDHNKPQRLSLPTYPFAMERYWVPNRTARSTEKNIADIQRPDPKEKIQKEQIKKEETKKAEIAKIGLLTFSVQENSNKVPGLKTLVPIELKQASGEAADKPKKIMLKPPEMMKNQLDISESSTAPRQKIQLAAAGYSVPGVSQNENTKKVSVSVKFLEENLRQSLAEVLDMRVEEIDEDTSFVDMGLDSIIGVEWIRKLNSHYKTSIAATKVYDYPTIKKFAKFIETEINRTGAYYREDVSQDKKETLPNPFHIEDRRIRLPESVLESSKAHTLSEGDSQEGPVISGTTLLEDLKQSLADSLHMTPDEVDLDTQFIDMGLDSIISVEWMRKVNSRYGVSISATKVYDYPNIRDFAAFLEKEISQKKLDSVKPPKTAKEDMTVNEIVKKLNEGNISVEQAQQLLMKIEP